MANVFLDKVMKAESKDGEIKTLHAKIGQLALLGGLTAMGWKTIFDTKAECRCMSGDACIAERE